MCQKSPPLATPAGQPWKLHRKPSASRVFVFSFHLEVSSVGSVQGLEKLIWVWDFIFPQLRNQESERHTKFCLRKIIIKKSSDAYSPSVSCHSGSGGCFFFVYLF